MDERGRPDPVSRIGDRDAVTAGAGGATLATARGNCQFATSGNGA